MCCAILGCNTKSGHLRHEVVTRTKWRVRFNSNVQFNSNLFERFTISMRTRQIRVKSYQNLIDDEVKPTDSTVGVHHMLHSLVSMLSMS